MTKLYASATGYACKNGFFSIGSHCRRPTYYPTRGCRLFGGQVMVQTGMYDRVPVYADTTIAPFSEICVPLGSGRMQIYERRRDRVLAGTTGSHTPTFPVESASVPPPAE